MPIYTYFVHLAARFCTILTVYCASVHDFARFLRDCGLYFARKWRQFGRKLAQCQKLHNQHNGTCPTRAGNLCLPQSILKTAVKFLTIDVICISGTIRDG